MAGFVFKNFSWFQGLSGTERRFSINSVWFQQPPTTLRVMNSTRHLIATGLHAQDIPLDVRAQLFAAHESASEALNDRAAFGGNTSFARAPLIDSSGRYAQVGCQGRLPAEGSAGTFDSKFGGIHVV